ncbi:MAG: hypothetical protein EOP44_07500 [Sphingobacteriaceae bacterium]|nr:MAG: hypothetical protein EOP44_07500 [Sphingobacteriaceae bacterium]
MAKKQHRKTGKKLSISFWGYYLLAYWSLCTVIYLVTDLFLDLYTTHEFLSVLWFAAILALPLAAYTLYAGRETLFITWYGAVFFSLIVYGLYLGSAYFTVLKLDLLLSAALKSTQNLELPVQQVNRVMARKGGFIYTDVGLSYQGKTIGFEGTRTSYFLLKPYHKLQVNIGQSYLGNDYVTHIELPAHERWAARLAYLKDWFSRYWWLYAAFALWVLFSILKDRFFPAHPAQPKPKNHPYKKKLRIVAVVLVGFFGLIMLILLLAGLLL